eukprot:4057169-Amphidinium_carterae.1
MRLRPDSLLELRFGGAGASRLVGAAGCFVLGCLECWRALVARGCLLVVELGYVRELGVLSIFWLDEFVAVRLISSFRRSGIMARLAGAKFSP